mmetsp:Transcript_24119/g.95024  ORF Transcript_24119/g.95024 Transcript_24119/m.95024 type:complete len:498 (-) Transcript_24119:199-1692(-)|eukprot:CAMPEP_0113958118 /NCGR_PEP_ID=MMETSP0011_2-20120614/3174_1 /TAXON_ID=101924 /ORGANISM="Rhodosorus marinus" /LENGTH=497 /DNA_ID=CAMNT_0000968809 /DNA_START=328 /DNA_END=1821 /DNA_ORIENTATION=+ /assembly_acc=CAM_ASM_000156
MPDNGNELGMSVDIEPVVESDGEREEPTVIKADSASDNQATPWLAVTILLLIAIFDVCVLMIPIPIAPEFVEGRLKLSGPHVGVAVGLISSAYHLGNSISSAMMGDISDVHGRKPVILLGMLTSCVSVVLFPLSTTLWMAVGNRFLCGFFNANITMTKSSLSDLSRTWDADRRNMVFGYLGAAWGLARFFSSAFVGFTSGIMLPFLPFAADNPFFFPCFASSCFVLLTTIAAALFLPETLPLRSRENRTNASDAQITRFRGTTMLGRLRDLKHFGGSALLKLLVLHMFHQGLNGGIVTCFVLLLALSDGEGGYGMSANEVGLVFSFYGVVGLFFQVFCYGPLCKTFGIRKSYAVGTFLLAVGSICLVLGTELVTVSNVNAVRMGIVMACTIPQAIGFMCGLPVLIVLIANASPHDLMGLTQGTAQSSGSFFRMLGPLVFAAFFSYSVGRTGPWGTFSIFAVGYFGMTLSTYNLPRSLEYPLKGSHLDSDALQRSEHQ